MDSQENLLSRNITALSQLLLFREAGASAAPWAELQATIDVASLATAVQSTEKAYCCCHAKLEEERNTCCCSVCWMLRLFVPCPTAFHEFGNPNRAGFLTCSLKAPTDEGYNDAADPEDSP